ncbi:Phosphatidylserine decarboxylase-related [Dillenia turbinata]|uniref:Phosphatidylserine decarboxylase-related n=1 Tax=Dillenia turbinata TaxID=194707 RepID=A0AAN8VVZ4_9MAGN
MKFRVSQRHPLFCHPRISQHQRRCLTSFVKKLQNLKRRASINGKTGNSEGSNPFVVPGATIATIIMVGLLHANRLNDDKKTEEARQRGIEFEFQPDVHNNDWDQLTILCFMEFFIHSLREGSRLVDPDPQSLVSPVDRIILKYGEQKRGNN